MKRAELVTAALDGEEVLLQHDFIVGHVTSCLVSLGQLYQGGWSINKEQSSGNLSLMSPGDEIRIPIEYRSFAIKAHVRQVVEMASSTDVAADGDGGQWVVRTVVCASDEVDGAPMGQCEMAVTADGTPYFKAMKTDYVNPRPAWGPYWPYCATLIRKQQGESRHWTVVELSAKFMDKRYPFGMIDQFLITVDFDADCEALASLGVEPRTLLVAVVVDESGDVIFQHDDATVGGLREELPAEEPKKVSVPDVFPPIEGESQPPVPEIEAESQLKRFQR